MTQPARPFSIKIFLPSGNPDGLRLVERSNWMGQGIVCPRSVYPESKKRDEFSYPGVYILEGSSLEGELPTIYIGEGDPVRPRLDEHYGKKDFWNRIIFFVSKDQTLNKAHIQYLESRLIGLAAEAKRCRLDNSKGSNNPSLSEADKADAESFLLDILSILPLLGMHVFEKPIKQDSKREVLTITAKNIKASGQETPEGFVVFEGSQMVKEETKSIQPNISVFRKELISQSVVREEGESYIFNQNYSFGSPSTAASVILGRSSNGRTDWKNKQGRSLKEIQEIQANS